METVWRNEQVPVLVLYNLRILVRWRLGKVGLTTLAFRLYTLTILGAMRGVLDLVPPSSTEARVLHDLFLGYATEALGHLCVGIGKQVSRRMLYCSCSHNDASAFCGLVPQYSSEDSSSYRQSRTALTPKTTASLFTRQRVNPCASFPSTTSRLQPSSDLIYCTPHNC